MEIIRDWAKVKEVKKKRRGEERKENDNEELESATARYLYQWRAGLSSAKAFQ